MPWVAQRNKRLGERKTMTNGMSCTLTTYRDALDVNCVWEDGSLTLHTTYRQFKSGCLDYRDVLKLSGDDAQHALRVANDAHERWLKENKREDQTAPAAKS